MRSTSGRFHLGLGKRSNTDDRAEREREASGSDQGGASERVVSGSGGNGGGNLGFGGRMGTGAMLKGKVAHTAILPSIIGNSELRQLQDLIHAEKSVLQSVDRASADISKACHALSVWGQTEGSDLADITTHASIILAHLSTGCAKFSAHQGDQRALWKSVRTREEELDELQKRRRNTYARAEKEEKKLAKMGQENKNLHAQTELLSSLRDQIRHMDTDIVMEEAKIGDFKRRATKEALGIKFNGLLELAEHLTIVGELGKLLIEEIPLEETPPGYGRAPYNGYATTERLSGEAAKCIAQVIFHSPDVTARPPGLPHTQPMAPLAPGSAGAGQQQFGVPENAHGSTTDAYARYAEAYGDDPRVTTAGAVPASAPKFTRFQSAEGGGPEQVHTPPMTGAPQLNKIMFDAPISPPFDTSRGAVDRRYESDQAGESVAQRSSLAPAIDSVSGQPHMQTLNIATATQPQHAAGTEQLDSPEPFSAVSRAGEGTFLSTYATEAIVQDVQHAHTAHATSARVSRLGNGGAEGLGAHGIAHPMSAFAVQPAVPTTASASKRQAYDHDLKEEGPRRVLRIEDWVIESVKKPILNGPEIDSASAELDIPLPEMTFGNNSLTLQYTPSPSSPGISLRFDALLALSLIPKGAGWESATGGAVQVAMAQSWGVAQANARAAGQKTMLSDGPIPDAPAKPFDWTYSTTFAGDVYVLGGPDEYDFRPTTTDKIPMDLLARQDPVLDKILFYDDVPLYEDELHDNGESILNVRIRVMPHSFFILARLFLRVDGVLFRTFDTRVFHQFGSGKVIREVCGRECGYADVKARLENPDDLTPLTDPNFVTQTLASMPIASAQPNEKPWPGLGIRTEVLVLPSVHQDPVETLATSDSGRPEALVRGPEQYQTPPVSADPAQVSFVASPNSSLNQGEFSSPNRPSIMSRGRVTSRGDEDGNDHTAYFVRNHAASPPQMPRDGKSVTRGMSGEIPPFTDARSQERENFGAVLPTPAGDRDAFYTPSETPMGIPAPARVGSPAVHGNGVSGPRTIAAGAFRRNKPTAALASGPPVVDVAGQAERSPSGSPRHSQQFGSPQVPQQSYTPVQLAATDAYNQQYAPGQESQVGASGSGVDPSLGLGAALPPPPPAYSTNEEAPGAGDQLERGYAAGQGEYEGDGQLR
ncbi:hypothetical protein NliqN6_0382 [Naganishia liquefaciens]|uniref:Uncharacterized protein n=1 Tax=Naganishia liquefaciens TaxID=104408 RepID=A0A8H3YC71_9TREE|nr:hypothetical protein NliqN6_0382 [Naganishia liquefaciens]